MPQLSSLRYSPMSDFLSFDGTCERSPLLLAIDTTSARCSLALSRGDEILAEWGVVQDGPGAHRVLDDLAVLLARVAISPDQIDALGALIGPGSFTGIRVGLAMTKGLAHALDKPIVTATTLETIACATPQFFRRVAVCVAVVAFRDQVHAQTFLRETDGATFPLADAQSGDGRTVIRDALKTIAAHAPGLPVMCVGAAAAALDETIRGYADDRAAQGYPLEWRYASFPRFLAAAGVPIFLARWREGACVSAAQLEAYYVQVSEAPKKDVST